MLVCGGGVRYINVYVLLLLLLLYGHDHSRDESKPFSDMTKTVEIFKTESHGLLPTITLAPASPPPLVGNEDSRLKVPFIK